VQITTHITILMDSFGSSKTTTPSRTGLQTSALTLGMRGGYAVKGFATTHVDVMSAVGVNEVKLNDRPVVAVCFEDSEGRWLELPRRGTRGRGKVRGSRTVRPEQRSRRKKGGKRFDSTRGYPGEGPCSCRNGVETMAEVSFDAKECKFDAACLIAGHWHKKHKKGAARRLAEQKKKSGRKTSVMLFCQEVLPLRCDTPHCHNGESALHYCGGFEDEILAEARLAQEFKGSLPTPLLEGDRSNSFRNQAELDVEDIYMESDFGASRSQEKEESSDDEVQEEDREEEEEGDEEDEGSGDELDEKHPDNDAIAKHVSDDEESLLSEVSDRDNRSSDGDDEDDMNEDEGDEGDEGDEVESEEDEKDEEEELEEEVENVWIYCNHLELTQKSRRLGWVDWAVSSVLQYKHTQGDYHENVGVITEIQHRLRDSRPQALTPHWLLAKVGFASVDTTAMYISEVFRAIYPHRYRAVVFKDIVDEALADRSLLRIMPVRADHTINQNLPLAVNAFIENHPNCAQLRMPAQARILLDTMNRIVNMRVLIGLLTMPVHNPYHTQMPLNSQSGVTVTHKRSDPYTNGGQQNAQQTKVLYIITLSSVLVATRSLWAERLFSLMMSNERKPPIGRFSGRPLLMTV